jgi:hypothetical protein
MDDQEGVDRFEELVGDFLGKQRIAIWGIDEAKGDQFVANKFRKRGVEVDFAQLPQFPALVAALVNQIRHVQKGKDRFRGSSDRAGQIMAKLHDSPAP